MTYKRESCAIRKGKRTVTTVDVASGFALPCAASGESKEDATRSAWHLSLRSRRPSFYSSFAGPSAARGLRRAALFVLLLMVAALMAPQALHSQTAAAKVTFAGAQVTLGGGLLAPYGVAVDAKGDVFIADTAHNRVVELPANGSATTTIGSGLNNPRGVAVDGAGDVFIADTGNSVVVKVPADGGAQTTVGSGLNFPQGVAVDGAGNVFIGDSGNGRVVELPANGGAQTTVASGLTSPVSVAVDRAGDVFIADIGQVVELPVGGSQFTIGSGLYYPQGVAVDGAGDVFIADTNNGRVVELPAGGGAQFTLESGLNFPHGMAVDGAGDVFIADTKNSRILEIERVAVNFGTANICPAGKTTPAPCSQTIALTYNVTSSGYVGAVNVLTGGGSNLDFTLASNTCTGVLTAGVPCTVNVKFAPLAAGPRMGAVQLVYGSGTTQTVLATTLIYGQGQGPAIAFGPGVQTKVGSGLSSPHGIAVDGAGDVFIADTSNNRVIEVPAGGGAQITLGSVLNYPNGIAVDGAGDVFVADSIDNQVVKFPTSGGAPTTLGNGLRSPNGIAVDGVGDLFIADTNNSRVVEIQAVGGAQIAVGTGLNLPRGVAVDGAGDVFIADTYNNRIEEVLAGGGAQITVASGLNSPLGVAVDGAGDVFIGDFGSGSVLEIPAGGGAQITLATGLNAPYGVAVNGMGDVFIADTFNNRALEVRRSQPPTLNFTSGVGNASYSQQVAVLNIGNQSLNAVSPGLTIGTNFKQVPGPGTPADCTSTFSLTPGASCNLSISFTPPTTGPFNGTAVLTDNALNAAAAKQSINLSGTGQALLTPVVHVTGGSFTYNGLAESASCTATGVGGILVSGSCSLTYNGSPNAPRNAGTYNVVGSFTSTNPYYGKATGTGQLTIAGAPLTITANSAVFLQAGTFPQLTVSYAGFVNGETQAVLQGTLKITTTATKTSPVGTYPIVPSGLTSTNYKISFADGTLTIQPPNGISGKYIIKNVNSALVLGVSGASTSAGANIVQWSSNGSADQKWTLTLAANGAYLIHDVNSGLVIGVSGASTSQGATLVQWQSNGSPDQQWRFTPSGPNWIITDVNSGLEMDIEGASKTVGAQSFQWSIDGSPSQLWTLIPVP